jgi:CBS domain-containing protein
VYDYVEGKVDWMAHGLTVEGEMGPFVGNALVDVPTCQPSDPVADVLARLEAAGQDRAVVVTGERCAVGSVDVKALRAAPGRSPVLEVMDLIPDSIRPHITLDKVDERAAGHLVTTPEGMLLGVVDPSALLGEHEHEHHQHHDGPAEQADS